MGIEARNVTKRYGEFVALDDVTVTVRDGSLTALLGPSGGGKSTLLRVIAGLEEPDEGTVIIGDEERMDVAAAERDILDAGAALIARHPDIGAILLECTNMAPYARALREHVKRPVFDIYSFMTWFHAGLSPRDFGHPSSAPRPWQER